MIPNWRISDYIPTYKGPHGHLYADRPIPTQHFMEVRRAVAHACVATQAAFLYMLFHGWMPLTQYHPKPGRFIDMQTNPHTAAKWKQESTAVWAALAKEGYTPDLMRAHHSVDHAMVHRLYSEAAQSLLGGT